MYKRNMNKVTAVQFEITKIKINSNVHYQGLVKNNYVLLHIEYCVVVQKKEGHFYVVLIRKDF